MMRFRNFKFLIVVLTLALFALSFVSPVFAQSEREFEFQQALDQGEDGGMNKQYFDAKTIEDIMLTAITAVGGPLEVAEGPNGPVYARKGGAVGMVSNLVGGLYATQPASSVEYLADLGSRLGLAKPAYAQGFGWTAFSPVLGLWKLFRNIAYLFFVIIFVVIGFMIMFRAKINPQTVIGIQNALPRIIVTLLLITFSYAIAGLIIDLGQVATRIIGNLLIDGENFLGLGPGGAEFSFNDLLNADIFKLVNPLRSVGELTKGLVEIEAGPSGIIKPIAWITGKAVFWIAGFFITFKIFFALLGPYVGIILSIIFAPLQLLAGAIPGSQGGIGSWLKGLAANVLVFPVTFTMLCIAAIFKSGDFMAQCPPPPSPIGHYAAWCTGSDKFILPWAPVTIGNWGAAAGELIGFGILFTIPKVAEMVKSIFAIKPTPWGQAATEEIRGAIGKVPLLGTFVKV